MPTMSVVIATHNKTSCLAPTLACLAAQTRAAEVIVVDDASEPPLPWLPGMTRRLRKEGPRHLQAARNLGIQAATGEIVVLMDDDCLVREDYVERHAWRHERDPGRLVVGSVRRIHYRGETEFWKLPPADVEEFRTFERHVERIPDNPAPWCLAPCSNNVSIACEALLRAGGYHEAYRGWGVDDVDLTFRLMMDGVPVLMDSAIWVYHHEHPRDEARQAAEEARSQAVFGERHGFWPYGYPPPEYKGGLLFPVEGAWFHAQPIMREGEPAAVEIRPTADPGPKPPCERWPLDWVVGVSAYKACETTKFC